MEGGILSMVAPGALAPLGQEVWHQGKSGFSGWTSGPGLNWTGIGGSLLHAGFNTVSPVLGSVGVGEVRSSLGQLAYSAYNPRSGWAIPGSGRSPLVGAFAYVFGEVARGLANALYRSIREQLEEPSAQTKSGYALAKRDRVLLAQADAPPPNLSLSDGIELPLREDPVTGDLYLLDRTTGEWHRIDPETGQVVPYNTVVDGSLSDAKVSLKVEKSGVAPETPDLDRFLMAAAIVGAEMRAQEIAAAARHITPQGPRIVWVDTMSSRQDDAQSSRSSNLTSGGAAISRLGLSLIPDAPLDTLAPIPGAAPGTKFAAEAAEARRAYRAANVMPAGTHVQHWTKELSAAATNMDPAVMNQNLSPLQSRNALPATTLLVSRKGAGTRYFVIADEHTAANLRDVPDLKAIASRTYGNEHTFADRFLIEQIEDQTRAANPNADPRWVKVEAGRQARWAMTGEPGPSPTPPPGTAPSSGFRAVLRTGGTVLAGVGTVFSGYAFHQDIAEGNWASAALNGTGFAGGGVALGGAAAGSTTLVSAGMVIAAPAALAGASFAGWKLGDHTYENTSISDVAMFGGSVVEAVTGSRTLGAIGAAGTAIVTAPVFVPIAIGKGIGRGAVWIWNKVF